MAIEIEYDKSNDCMVVVVTGIVDYNEFHKLAIDLIEHEKFKTDINQLVDCSNGELSVTTNDLQKIAADFTSIEDILGLERKLALLVSRDADFGRMRQYEVFFQSGPGVKVHVFRSLDEAHKWLLS